jgi:hypothetical protein
MSEWTIHIRWSDLINKAHFFVCRVVQSYFILHSLQEKSLSLVHLKKGHPTEITQRKEY